MADGGENRIECNRALFHCGAEHMEYGALNQTRSIGNQVPTRGCGYCFEANCRSPISFLVNRRLCASKVRVCSSKICIYEGKWDSDAVICPGLRTRCVNTGVAALPGSELVCQRAAPRLRCRRAVRRRRYSSAKPAG